MGEYFFRYRLTPVVPNKRPLNGCACVYHRVPAIGAVQSEFLLRQTKVVLCFLQLLAGSVTSLEIFSDAP